MIAKIVHENLKNASWIRRMFVEGAKLREQFGDENVYDYSIGNPYFEPPKAVTDKLKDFRTHWDAVKKVANETQLEIEKQMADTIYESFEKGNSSRASKQIIVLSSNL